MNKLIERSKVFKCPQCNAILNIKNNALFCDTCKREYPAIKGSINFNTGLSDPDDNTSEVREFFKQYPRFYYFIATIFGPMMWTGLGAKAFFKQYYKKGGTCINLGSGPKFINSNIINIDITPYKGVHIVANINNLPILDNSVENIICDTVIEHLDDPKAVIKEIYRILSPGGYVYITAPFLYPFHSSPYDFTRWTKIGFINMLSDFNIVKSGVRAGPFSTLTVYCCYLFALIFSFNSKKLFWLLANISMFIFFPLKLADIFISRLFYADNLSAVMYYIVQKK